MSTERKKDYKIYVFFSYYKVKQSKIDTTAFQTQNLRSRSPCHRTQCS